MMTAHAHPERARGGGPWSGRGTGVGRSLLTGKPRVPTWPGVVISLAAHVTVFGGAWIYARYTPPRVVPEKPIVAKLVRLGKPRDEKLLPRLPARPKPAPPAPSAPPPPEPKAAPPAPAPTPAPIPTPAPKAVAPAVEPKKEEKPAPPAQPDPAERQRRMAEALSALGPAPDDGPTGKVDEPLPGQEDGDPFGDSDDAAEGDRYLGMVEAALKRNYVLPTTIPPKERLYLSCKLRLFISEAGRIERWEIEESSGNPHFDRAVEASIQRTRVPPPPKAFVASYGRSGIGLHFRP